ncbi:hypothetical protein [Brevundimonas sp. Root1279]|uniref:hypothetical protein n=1 Tax=Brevundimonas sp. Root1279 TaxID=1736443 RepID=UPI000AC4A90D|nr:hypothetical protein [Brevundimonas sp. Root1279]
MDVRALSGTASSISNPLAAKVPSEAKGQADSNPAYVLDLSPEARVAIEGSQSAASTQTTPPPPVPTLPDVVVEAVRVKAAAFEADLRSQQNPSVPDYGQIAIQVNMYYSQQMGIAGGAQVGVNQHVRVDTSVNLNDPKQKAAVDTVKNDLIATVYQAMSNPDALINGPDTADVTARDWFSLMQTVDLVLMGGTNPRGAAGETDINGPRTTITIWPSMVSGYFGSANLTDAGSATTILYHELGHAALRVETTARFQGWYTAQLGPPNNMTPAQAAAAWPTSSAAILDQQRATAFGQGLATMTGGVVAQSYSGSSIPYGSAPQ